MSDHVDLLQLRPMVRDTVGYLVLPDDGKVGVLYLEGL